MRTGTAPAPWHGGGGAAARAALRTVSARGAAGQVRAARSRCGPAPAHSRARRAREQQQGAPKSPAGRSGLTAGADSGRSGPMLVRAGASLWPCHRGPCHLGQHRQPGVPPVGQFLEAVTTGGSPGPRGFCGPLHRVCDAPRICRLQRQVRWRRSNFAPRAAWPVEGDGGDEGDAALRQVHLGRSRPPAAPPTPPPGSRKPPGQHGPGSALLEAAQTSPSGKPPRRF